MKTDCHMHTNFSTDAKASPEEMIEGAIQKGLKAICFTDHQDVDYPLPGEFGFNTEAYFEKLLPLKEQYKSQIDIRIGVEIGLQEHLSEYYKTYVNQYPFDYVIGSLHLVEKVDPYWPEYFQKYTDKEGYERAFTKTLHCIEQISDFDSLGHIDYIVRYGKEKARDYSYEAFKESIDAILVKIIEMGKGIELNTAGFKYGLGFSHPHPDILKRYRELGGEIVTIGADGHRPDHIAYEFDKVSEILQASGFKYYTEFVQRRPIFRQL